MRIVVLIKPVPDTASGGERLRPDDWRLDRTAVPAVVNANDEYALEAALKLTEAHGGEVIVVSMAGPGAPDTMRKAFAMGAASGTLVSDDSLAGSDILSTTRVLAGVLRGMEYDLVIAGADTSDGGAGVVPPGVATLLGLPYLSYAAKIEPNPEAGTVRVNRISPTGYEILEAPMPALVVATQALGEPRYPSLKGIMAARSKTLETKSVADVAVGDAAVGGAVATTAVLGSEAPPPRAATR
ncbi:MAG TPA: electron transfer flavoprotein subunit beta/FixA family protein, partial [Candidatus Limnocylindrales bacterium]|nr:electron transfer flavoprotein subunit beta/FixA family protein [Candidatus Limnocylindrales bacterium]